MGKEKRWRENEEVSSRLFICEDTRRKALTCDATISRDEQMDPRLGTATANGSGIDLPTRIATVDYYYY